MSHVEHRPAGGWLPAGAHLEWQRDDQGKDLVTNWRGPLIAPGDGECVGVGSNSAFPNGFGPAYPLVRIDTGKFAGHVWYLGHCTTAVRAGQRFKRGDVLAHADQGFNFEGTHGGWVELGTQLPSGALGPNTHGAPHWFDALLRESLVIKVADPPLRYGDKGQRPLELNRGLLRCKYMTRLDYLRSRNKFTSRTHGAVILYKQKHGFKLPAADGKRDRGVVSDALYDRIVACRTR